MGVSRCDVRDLHSLSAFIHIEIQFWITCVVRPSIRRGPLQTSFYSSFHFGRCVRRWLVRPILARKVLLQLGQGRLSPGSTVLALSFLVSSFLRPLECVFPRSSQHLYVSESASPAYQLQLPPRCQGLC